MVEEKTDEDNEVLQKVLLHPKGVMLWSKNTIRLFHQRCRDDIVYIDATGSIVQKARGKSAPFYVYELVVRHPIKGSSPIPVATYVTCQHTTASVLFFMESFQTDYYKLFGRKSVRRPVMIMCDGSLVLMQAVAYTFCKLPLESLLSMYYDIVTGNLKEVMDMPILHRCLSHIMKNAKVFCRKHSPKHYRLSMHLFGLLTSAATLMEMDDIITSMAVLFSSPQSGENVEKHFQNLQNRLQTIGFHESSDHADNDFEITMGPTIFQSHF
ncbi:hypothetical protein R3I93_019973 [Phoxinus phoxinus]|uniref:Uncharacterized protein n=1 Tax=Phoxinus phoxinus TaxID=58324 RepID=A0AAN9CEY4_9TELE